LIRINLAPPSALKDKVWFVPELVFFFIISASVYTGVQFYLKSIEDETAKIRAEIDAINRDTENLSPDIARFEQVSKQIDMLKEKLKSLESLTVSKVGRYMPIIILENIQRMKPNGLWLNTFHQNSRDQQISITGGSFDNLLIAEFINAINATRTQQIDPQDVRTYVYFSNVLLERIASDVAQQTESSGPVAEKTEMQKALEATEVVKPSNKTAGESKIFPELKNFPSFTMTLKYAERVVHLEDTTSTKKGKK